MNSNRKCKLKRERGKFVESRRAREREKESERETFTVNGTCWTSCALIGPFSLPFPACNWTALDELTNGIEPKRMTVLTWNWKGSVCLQNKQFRSAISKLTSDSKNNICINKIPSYLHYLELTILGSFSWTVDRNSFLQILSINDSHLEGD